MAIEVTVGLAFIVSAMLAPAATRERLLFGSVGFFWLLGSVLPAALLTHQSRSRDRPPHVSRSISDCATMPTPMC